MLWSRWIQNCSCQIQILIFLVNLEILNTSSIETKDAEGKDLQQFLPGNDTSDFLLGFGNDPFGTKMIESTTIVASGKRRSKRSVVHLYSMVQCATGCDPLAYKGYGCYCGFLGSGYVVDGIDRCCQMHDWCYDTSGCPVFLEYFVPYLWKCYHRRPLCGIEIGSTGSCGQRLCHCDQLLAQCLQRYPCPSTKAICTSSPWRLLQNIFML